MKIYVRRAGIACLVFIVVAVVFMAFPAVRLAATTGVLDACVNGGNGMMRLVVSSSACHANETFVEWNITGPAGPQGPQGPAGSSAGGPPFVWVCTPANVDLGGNGDHDAEIDVFNGSTSTANLAAHFLAKDGTNVGGQPIPGTGGAFNYPGETGTTTVTVAPQTTRIYTYSLGSGLRDGNSALLATVTVTSDQPVVVGSTQGSNGNFNSAPCGLLPK